MSLIHVVFPGSTAALNQIRTSDCVGQQRSEVDSILVSSSSSVPTLEPQPVESSAGVKVGCVLFCWLLYGIDSCTYILTFVARILQFLSRHLLWALLL